MCRVPGCVDYISSFYEIAFPLLSRLLSAANCLSVSVSPRVVAGNPISCSAAVTCSLGIPMPLDSPFARVLRRWLKEARISANRDLYKINRRYEDSRDILLLAYDRHPGGRTIVYSLCELSIKLEEYVIAIEYYKEFVQIAPKDTGRYILQYKLYQAQDVSLEERIAVLEELKAKDYREKWAYELAYLYHRVGLATGSGSAS